MIGHLYLGRYALGRCQERRPCAPEPWTRRRHERAQTPFKLDDAKVPKTSRTPKVSREERRV